MELEIRPEPPEHVRAAIAEALRAAAAERSREADEGDAWWRAGLEEAVAEQP